MLTKEERQNYINAITMQTNKPKEQYTDEELVIVFNMQMKYQILKENIQKDLYKKGNAIDIKPYCMFDKK